MDVTWDTLVIGVAVLVLALIAVGGGVYGMLRQKVLVDTGSRQVVEIELPGFGKFKTNYPSIGAIVLGLLMSYAVLQWFDVKKEKLPFIATVTVQNLESEGGSRAEVFLNVVPQRYKRSQSGAPSMSRSLCS